MSNDSNEGQLRGVYAQIAVERVAQDEQWGGAEHDDTHDAPVWLDCIEYQASALMDAYNGNEDEPADMAQVRKRFIKIAALAVAAIQSHDRKAKAAQ